MAQSLKIEVITLEHKPEDKILSRLYSESPGIMTFLVLEGLEGHAGTAAKTSINPAYLQKDRTFLYDQKG